MDNKDEICTSELVVIGTGRRRVCFQMPQDDLCVKFYRLPSEFTPETRWSVRLEIILTRFLPLLNVNCQEWRYHTKMRQRLPEDLFAVFPETIFPVYSRERGWGIVETQVKNWDNSSVRSVCAEMCKSSDLQIKKDLFDATAQLFDQLVEHAVCFYDPPNVLVQWTKPTVFQLRIVDFEPRTRALIPGLSYIKPYVRSKVRRRSQRYLSRLQSVMAASGPPDVITVP